MPVLDDIRAMAVTVLNCLMLIQLHLRRLVLLVALIEDTFTSEQCVFEVRCHLLRQQPHTSIWTVFPMFLVDISQTKFMVGYLCDSCLGRWTVDREFQNEQTEIYVDRWAVAKQFGVLFHKTVWPYSGRWTCCHCTHKFHQLSLGWSTVWPRLINSSWSSYWGVPCNGTGTAFHCGASRFTSWGNLFHWCTLQTTEKLCYIMIAPIRDMFL